MRHFYRVFEDFEHAGEEGYRTSITIEIPEFHIELSSAGKSLIERRKEYLAEYFRELKRLHKTREIPIQAIGVWDTVGALGIPTTALLQRVGLPAFLADPLMTPNPYRFTDTTIGKNVRHAFQALALDERRSSFSPTIWEQPDAESDQAHTVLKQVWFPGAHADVGGSEPDSGLADVSLAWMMSELETAGLEFDEAYLADQWRLNRWEYAERAAAASSSSCSSSLSLVASAASNTLLRLLRSPLSFLPTGTANHKDADDDAASDADLTPAVRALSRRNETSSPEPHWALTRLHDSAADTITALGGLSARTPLAFHRTDYATGKRLGSADALLRNTHERVHASVRARVQARGEGFDGVGVYGADALRVNGWVVERKKDVDGGGWRWVNRNGGPEVRGKVLEEDGLGRFEVMLLREDADMAAWLLGGGRGAARVAVEVADESSSSSSSS
ncbi:hypothetical protein BK809_0001168 [Diplodia seriata]|uniref:T6SS Phospholipase effector Tle1-like catalytic domain-containing protein n=1 Tax=Diplodia seriata TaxID=420778 RepID=A0A1S8B624_9PEZI|nr:hypothetical protein BK809_0001168 [Diplodia seriata]